MKKVLLLVLSASLALSQKNGASVMEEQSEARALLKAHAKPFTDEVGGYDGPFEGSGTRFMDEVGGYDSSFEDSDVSSSEAEEEEPILIPERGVTEKHFTPEELKRLERLRSLSVVVPNVFYILSYGVALGVTSNNGLSPEEQLKYFAASYVPSLLGSLSLLIFGTLHWRLSQKYAVKKSYRGLWMLPPSLISLIGTSIGFGGALNQNLKLMSVSSFSALVKRVLMIGLGLRYWWAQKKKSQNNLVSALRGDEEQLSRPYSCVEKYALREVWMVVQGLVSLVASSIYVTAFLMHTSTRTRVTLLNAADWTGLSAFLVGMVMGMCLKKEVREHTILGETDEEDEALDAVLLNETFEAGHALQRMSREGSQEMLLPMDESTA